MTSRARLLRLYARDIAFSDAALSEAAASATGTTASYAKELIRRAVLEAAIAGHPPSDADLAHAQADLLADSETLTRALLGVDPRHGPDNASGGPGRPGTA